MEVSGKYAGIFRNFENNKSIISFEINEIVTPEMIEKISTKDKKGNFPKLKICFDIFREKRSLDANAYYWQLLSKLAPKLHISTAFLHNQYLRKLSLLELIDGQAMRIVIPETEEAEKKVDEAEKYHLKPTSQVKAGNDGLAYRTYVMLRGSHTFDSKEMSQLIDLAVWDAKEQGIETIPPDELKGMLERYGVKHG